MASISSNFFNLLAFRPRDGGQKDHQSSSSYPLGSSSAIVNPSSLIVRLKIPELMSEALTDHEALMAALADEEAEANGGHEAQSTDDAEDQSLIVKLKVPLDKLQPQGKHDQANGNGTNGSGDGGSAPAGTVNDAFVHDEICGQSFYYQASSPNGAGGICTVM